MLLGNAESTLCHRRFDLSNPALIFGGLLITATAICGTLQVPATPVIPVEEVVVLNDENVIAPEGIDPFAVSCDVKNNSNGSGTMQMVSATSPANCHPASSPNSARAEDQSASESGSSSASDSLH
jgi:hypothetical protein